MGNRYDPCGTLPVGTGIMLVNIPMGILLHTGRVAHMYVYIYAFLVPMGTGLTGVHTAHRCVKYAYVRAFRV